MEQLSVFDIFKIGVGPSSSHTMGPWRAAQRFLNELQTEFSLEDISTLQVILYGSLAKTGKGHGTDIAILLGLAGEDPVTCDTRNMWQTIAHIKTSERIDLLAQHSIPFRYNDDLIFQYAETLPFHPNGLQFVASFADETHFERTYFSIGGGFITTENENLSEQSIVDLTYTCHTGSDILAHCTEQQFSISKLAWQNELAWRTPNQIRTDLLNIWLTMRDCVYRGCHTSGELPGGLRVTRRASRMSRQLLNDRIYNTVEDWMAAIQGGNQSFHHVLKWVSCFALAVNEENAAYGRVVTAPTNGAAGVIPATLMYYVCFHRHISEDDILKFLLVSAQIGMIFKKGATISAAMGGCQAEIGVSSSMAAAALTECLGGTVEQALMAAEIAMEHHLGLTCDPIGGLVQVPCIERNTMGTIKAITAANIALGSDPHLAKVSLDDVVKVMWDTAQHMDTKFKETAEGGLAIHIPVNVVEC